MKQAVILVGGLGSRLGTLAGNRPKPFIEVGGKPFIDRLIYHAKCQGMKEVLLLAGHAAEWVQGNYKCSVDGIQIKVCVEEQPMGTAGALLSAVGQLDETFLLMNGDSILNGNWTALYPLLNDDVAIAIATRTVDNSERYGCVENSDGYVTKFAEKAGQRAGEINAGIYAVRRDALLKLIKGKASLENEVIPTLVSERRVRAVTLNGFFIDIGLPDTLAWSKEYLLGKLEKPAIFFDRDNTLVEDKGYTHKVSDLVWKPDVIETIRKFNDIGYYVFVITNQAGVARGYYTETMMHKFHEAMQRELLAYGAHIDAFYHCPHHPDGSVEALSFVCDCRKPATGLLEQACQNHLIDIDESLMIGDKETDITCGQRYGVSSHLYSGGSLMAFCKAKGVMG